VKGRIPLLLLVGSSATFLASLYLTWVSAGDPTRALRTRHGALSILNLFSNAFAFNGWGAFGQAAAIAAVALGLLAVVSLIRPELESALPLGGCAIALAALALVNVADLRTQGIYRAGYMSLSAHVSTGAYVGGAAALVALLAAAWVSHDEISDLGSAVAATLLTIGLVAAYVLPTLSVHTQALKGAGGYQFVWAGSYGTAIMILIASFGLTFWFGAAPPIRRISAAAIGLVLVIGGFSVLGTHTHWPYEAWLAIGCAIGLVVLAAISTRERPLVALGRADAIALAGATLLLVSLFFNWQKACYGNTCYVSNGWGGGLAGGLAGLFVVLLLGFLYLSPEIAGTVAIYVLGAGLTYTAHGSLGYGAFIGFAGAALLLVAVGLQPRKPVHGGVRLVPVAASLAFLAIPVATLTGRLSTEIEINGEWRLLLLEAAAIVVGLRLIGRWLSGPAADNELLLLPVALLALTTLDLAERLDVHTVGWEGWLGLILSVLLVVLGWVGRRGGLDKFRIPDEIWRVDRISTGEN
jgi:hypothetical protein